MVLSLLVLGCSPPPGEPAGPRLCNGHAALCDRPLNEVTLPATHNAMSNADAGWAVPNQQHGLTQQLQDGVRAMLLDTYEWNDELWLCHGYCELGAEPLEDGFAELATFLGAHPDEVMVLVLEDYISAEQTVEVMDSVGLTPLACRGEPAEWPTLGELLDAGTRVVVTAESGGPPPDVYHHAWDLLFDTPYAFTTEAEFTCDLNRGASDNPFFLVNHWLEDPFPSEELAARANAADVLGTRARACAEQWGRPVSLLAVDLYATGDLFQVVDELNGLSE